MSLLSKKQNPDIFGNSHNMFRTDKKIQTENKSFENFQADLEINKKNDNQNSYGVIFWQYMPKNIRYEGQLQNNLPEGYGKLYFFKTGNLLYEGQFKLGKKDGFGREFYEFGNLYFQGNWKEDKKHGKGKEYYSNEQLLIFIYFFRDIF